MFGIDVFTSKGVYCGKASDLEFDLSRFKIRSLVIEAGREGLLGKMIGGKKGIIIPYSAIQAVGDIVIIKHITLPEAEEEEVTEEETEAEK
jgi:sporulation protein YlmC with PRC-barrel domain